MLWLNYKTQRLRIMNNYNEITDKIIGAAIEVHRELGPCLLESVYEECMEYELNQIICG
jgi:hypothetical protein